MRNVAQNTSGISDATLFDAIRAEVDAARGALRTNPERVITALEVIEGLLDGCETSIRNVIGLVDGAEEQLGAAALAFAHVDSIAQQTSRSSRDRGSFSLAIGEAVACLRSIPFELASVRATSDELTSSDDLAHAAEE